jgi:hypothetical protein
MSYKNKYSDVLNVEEYIDKLYSNLHNNENDISTKKLIKVLDDKFVIPNKNEYEHLTKYNYNMSQLKNIAKEYKLKVTGTKPQLTKRIYSYLYFSFVLKKIQSLARGYLRRKYNYYHGPALTKRQLCTNANDFLSMDPLNEIPYEQFFSYKDDDGLIYGFDLLSLHNLIYKSDGQLKNPYTTKIIKPDVITNFRTLIRLSHVLKITISIELRDTSKDVSDKKNIELRAITLFQNIDSLGNYSNAQWFLSLNRNNLIRFLRELIDIWNYRAPLTNLIKRQICPPAGNPFYNINSLHLLNIMENVDDIKKTVLKCMENMVNSGIDKDSKCLGAYYVLGALTLVSADAATALPWLYQAVAYV